VSNHPGPLARADRLADMPLRVLRDVGQQPDHRRRQLVASDASRVLERRRVDRPHDRLGVPQRRVQNRQRFLARAAERMLLIAQRLHLRFRKLPLLEIAHEPVRAPGDVHDMESRGSEAVRRRPKLFRREAVGVLRQILTRLLERVEDGSDERMDAWNRTAQPRLRRHHCAAAFLKNGPLR